MISAARLLILSSVILSACNSVHKAAVTTFHVVDAPARYVRDRIDPPQTTTTTEGTSDVVTPGQPINTPARETPSAHGRVATQNRETSPDSQTSAAGTEAPPAPRKSSVSAPQPATKTAQFPTARQVPGKPGFVYSIDPKGGIIDVTGYKTGDRAKDPYTKQIFIVP